MRHDGLDSLHAEMRSAYVWGAPGVAVSGLVWALAAVLAFSVSFSAGLWALLLGGTVIFPVSVLACKALGAKGSLSQSNPLRHLASEVTFWLLAGIAIAFGLQALRPAWFFPAMLLLIGGRYLTFQTLYGLRVFWLAGGVLCTLGVVLALARAQPPISATAGALVELALAAWLLAASRKQTNAV